MSPTSRRPRPEVLTRSGVRSRAHEHVDVSPITRPTGPPSTRLALGEVTTPWAAVRLVGAAPRLRAQPRGDGHLVVDVPGWKAPELTGLPIRRYLAWLGYEAASWGLGTNTGSPERDADLLARSVVTWAQDRGAPVSLVGWSLGGVIAREVARRHPEHVRTVITYGTPVVGGPSFTAVARAYDAATRDRAARTSAELDAASPIRVPLTAIYSRRDGVVSWRACVDRVSPSVDHVEVGSTHLGLGLDPDVWAVVAARLHTSRPD